LHCTPFISGNTQTGGVALPLCDEFKNLTMNKQISKHQLEAKGFSRRYLPQMIFDAFSDLNKLINR